jgi:hypothetical protein
MPIAAATAVDDNSSTRRLSRARGVNVSTESSQERRWGVRVSVDLPVRLGFGRNSSATGRMRDASISGALIECAMEIPTFTQLQVEIPADGTSLPEPLQLAARVVRAEHPWLGVEWRDVPPPALESLLLAGEPRSGVH